MKINLYFLVFLFALLSFSCAKKEETPDKNTGGDPPINTTLTQYGVPFDNVCDRQDASIYQVNIRAFSESGDFQGVTDRLDDIQALGVNVIYLMPIYPLGKVKGINSPYCVQDYTSVNSEFGSLGDLRILVAGAHDRNMSVILDWVANHTAWDNSWITSHKDWYLQDADSNIVSPPGTGWNDVAQLNFKNADMRLEMIKSMKYWVLAANVDGYRCDYTDGPPVDFWKQAIDTLRNISTHKLLMLAEGSRFTNYSAGFDFNFGFAFFSKMKDIYGKNLAATSIEGVNLSEFNGSADGQQVVRYISNHDVNSSDGTPLDLFGGVKGSLSAFLVAAFGRGVPMIYGGQEVGNTSRLSFPFTSSNIDWTLNPDLTAEYAKIIAYRNNSEAIRRGQYKAYSSKDVYAFTKEVSGVRVFILINVRNSVITYTIPAVLDNMSCQDEFNGGTVNLSGQISLEPYGFYVFKM